MLYRFNIFFDPVLSCTSHIEVWPNFSFVWLVCHAAYSKNNHSSVPKHPLGKFLTHQKFRLANAGSSIAEIVLGVDFPSEYLFFFPTVANETNAITPHCMKLPTIKVAGLTTQNCPHLLGHMRVNIYFSTQWSTDDSRYLTSAFLALLLKRTCLGTLYWWKSNGGMACRGATRPILHIKCDLLILYELELNSFSTLCVVCPAYHDCTFSFKLFNIFFQYKKIINPIIWY